MLHKYITLLLVLHYYAATVSQSFSISQTNHWQKNIDTGTDANVKKVKKMCAANIKSMHTACCLLFLSVSLPRLFYLCFCLLAESKVPSLYPHLCNNKSALPQELKSPQVRAARGRPSYQRTAKHIVDSVISGIKNCCIHCSPGPLTDG